MALDFQFCLILARLCLREIRGVSLSMVSTSQSDLSSIPRRVGPLGSSALYGLPPEVSDIWGARKWGESISPSFITISDDFITAFDFVLNHCSSPSSLFLFLLFNKRRGRGSTRGLFSSCSSSPISFEECVLRLWLSVFGWASIFAFVSCKYALSSTWSTPDRSFLSSI